MFRVAVLSLAALTISVALLIPELPEIESIQTLKLKVPLRVYSNDGLLMAEYGSERRIPVRVEDAPPLLIAAVLAAEDDRYYQHSGIDYQGIVRAIFANLRTGSIAQGASTITMQVARNYYLSRERTYVRKAKEALLSIQLESYLSKDEILELYLNKIFLGHRAYGFGAAARAYYGKPLSELDLAQFAMLAALPKSPSRINPLTNPENARTRRNYILGRMLKLDYITKSEYEQATTSELTAAYHISEVELDAPYVAEYVRQAIYEKFGENAYEDGYQVFATVESKYQRAATRSLREGLITYDQRHGFRGALRNWDITLLDTEEKIFNVLKQLEPSREIIPVLILEVLEDHVNAVTKSAQKITIPWEHMQWARRYITVRQLGPKLNKPSDVVKVGDIVFARPVSEVDWELMQIPQAEGALIAIDPENGAIKAMAGGFDYYLNKFNRATQAVRQMGSNIKPFVYSAALDRGFTAASLVSGAPVVVADSSTNIVWRPENYSGKVFGPTRLRKALSLSLNLVSVRLMRGIGQEFTVDHVNKFGFDRETLPEGLALALGSATATPLDVVSGYSVIANGGYEIEPYVIEIVKNRHGVVVMRGKTVEVCNTCLPSEESEDPGELVDLPTVRVAKRVISNANAYIMNNLLREVIDSGTARKAKVLGRPDLGGKTGTTNNFEDAWFSGFTSKLAATAWVGFDTPADLGRHESGSKAALPFWIDFMRVALENVPVKLPLKPDNILVTTVHSKTGAGVAEDDPQGLQEVFIVGSEPRFTAAYVQTEPDSGIVGSEPVGQHEPKSELF